MFAQPAIADQQRRMTIQRKKRDVIIFFRLPWFFFTTMDTFSPDLRRFYNPDLSTCFLLRLPKLLDNFPDDVVLQHSLLKSFQNEGLCRAFSEKSLFPFNAEFQGCPL